MELPTKSRYWSTVENEIGDLAQTPNEARAAKTLLRRFVETCYTQLGGKPVLDGGKADTFAVHELRKSIELLNKAIIQVLKAWPKQDPEYPSLNRLVQALLGVQMRTVQKQTEIYKQALNDAASLSDPTEWDRQICQLLRQSDIDWQGPGLAPDKEVLLMTVGAYLIEMGNLPWNVFDQFLKGETPNLSSGYVKMFREFANVVEQNCEPLLALAATRGLRHLFFVNSEEEPDWPAEKISQLCSQL